jgi:hypothetical protein
LVGAFHIEAYTTSLSKPKSQKPYPCQGKGTFGSHRETSPRSAAWTGTAMVFLLSYDTTELYICLYRFNELVYLWRWKFAMRAKVILSVAMTLGRHFLCKKHVILNWSAAEVKNLVVW